MDPTSRLNELNPAITVRKAQDVRRLEDLAKTHWLCSLCAHYTDALTCAAFPDGIPLDVVSGQTAHIELFGIEAAPVVFTEILKPKVDEL